MELDKRIIKGKRPLTCLDIEQAREFEGKQCLFSDSYVNYKNIREYAKYPQYTGILHIEEDTKRFLTKEDYVFRNGTDGYCYSLVLPCEWVEEKKEPKEPKYREYKDLDEFFDVTGLEIGDLIHLKFPGDNDAELLIVGGCDDCLFIGIHKYTFAQLFAMVKISISGEWQPFGVLEE